MDTKDFFVSYNSHDQDWAEWIAWMLEDAGYSVVIQAWDFRPGGNFVLDMQQATQDCHRTIAVLSEHYLQAKYTQPEWAAAFARDPQGQQQKLLPVRVSKCDPSGLLNSIVYVNLVECSETEARQRLLTMLQERAKPTSQPSFPGKGRQKESAVVPVFPGDMQSTKTSEEPMLSFGVYGWDVDREEAKPTVELDWREYCDRTSRKVPDLDIWEFVLFPQLQQAKQTLSGVSTSRYIYLLGLRPLTMSLTIGFMFPYVAGYQFRVKQPTGGQTVFWETSVPPSAARLRVCREQGMEGDNLIFAVGISANAWDDVSQFHKNNLTTFNAMVYAEPEQGAGQQSLKSDGDAVALAFHAKELMRQYRRQYQAKQIHLILACPAAFAVFLGQQLNALGRIVAYERTEEGGYQSSVSLRTG